VAIADAKGIKGVSMRRSDRDFAQYIRGQVRYGRIVAQSGLYPRLTRYRTEAAVPHSPNREEQSFKQGLRHVTDGVAARLPQP
jgi:hypothetical protein